MGDLQEHLKTIKSAFVVIFVFAVFLPLLQFTPLSKNKKQEELMQLAKAIEEQQKLKEEREAIKSQQENIQQNEEIISEESQEEQFQQQEEQEEIATQEPIQETVEESPLEYTQEPSYQKETQKAQESAQNPAQNEEMDRLMKLTQKILSPNTPIAPKEVEIARIIANEKKQQGETQTAFMIFDKIYNTTNLKDDLFAFADCAIETGNKKRLKRILKRHLETNPQDAQELEYYKNFVNQ